MILTREAQERMVAKYSENKSTREVLSFIDGIGAVVSLMIKNEIDREEFYKKIEPCK